MGSSRQVDVRGEVHPDPDKIGTTRIPRKAHPPSAELQPVQKTGYELLRWVGDVERLTEAALGCGLQDRPFFQHRSLFEARLVESPGTLAAVDSRKVLLERKRQQEDMALSASTSATTRFSRSWISAPLNQTWSTTKCR